MYSQVNSCGLLGLEGQFVSVETDISNGLPLFDIVGLADTAVKEARERVRAAIKNTGLKFPAKRVIVNLSPADTRKEGAGFDLPIAVGTLASMGNFRELCDLQHFAFIGELSLDGRLRPVTGMLSKALAVRDAGCHTLVLPRENAREASWVDGLTVLPAENLSEVYSHLIGECPLKAYCKKANEGINWKSCLSDSTLPDFSDVRGQESAKRAIEIAAAGGHNILLEGSAGAGKTMLAKRIAGILPNPSFSESIELTRIHSVAGLLGHDTGLISIRPFRAPHHSISTAGLIGGGKIPKPGEISLAHAGVLFLDELPEFSRYSLDALRQPIEEGRVSLSRIQASITYPCKFILVAAANPCKCGHYGDSVKPCTCPLHEAERYYSKISAPLLDRIDIRINVPGLVWGDVINSAPSESSQEISRRVLRAREIQQARYKEAGVTCNAQLSGRALRLWCALDGESLLLMERSFILLSLSMRSHDRILKVARTIADLSGSEAIRSAHLAEAIQYRGRHSGTKPELSYNKTVKQQQGDNYLKDDKPRGKEDAVS